MIAAIKSEFRKLLTVRSTYIITGIVLLIVIFVAFYVLGWRLDAKDQSPLFLTHDVIGALNLAIFGAIVAVLLVSHEYRYNTINYSLVSSNNRGKVLTAKFIVTSVYSLVLAALIGVLAPLMGYLGVIAHGHTLVPQNFDLVTIVWTTLFYGWGLGVAGFVLAILLRNQVLAIVSIFIIPNVIEGFIGALLLKHNAVYMPFHALNQVINSQAPAAPGNPISSSMSASGAAFIFIGYLIVAGLIGWLLFMRRDAN